MSPTGGLRSGVRVLCVVCGLALGLPVAAAHAQDSPAPYKPEVGQAGKDVVWVPTAQTLVDRMLDMAKVTAADVVVDLGSGDGRTVITAAKRGATALGIEYNPDMVALSRRIAEKEGVGDRARFVHGDVFATDFSHATVVTMFLLPNLNLRLRPRILGMKPGTRVVSNSFDMDDWEPDDYAEVAADCENYCRAFLWIVPADVAGSWSLAHGQLTLRQNFQTITGTLTLDGKAAGIANGKVTGDAIAFTAGGRAYGGKLNGASIAFTGESPNGQPVGTATRTGR